MIRIKRVLSYVGSRGGRLRRKIRGVSTVEYALIVVAIIAIVGAVAAQLGGAFEDLFDSLDDQMQQGVTDVDNAGGGGPAAPSGPPSSS